MRNATKKRETTRAAYVQRVNLAIDYVFAHLGEPLRLEAVSRAASLSPFHFHRVFQAIVGETLADFVKRLRLERALSMMAHAPRTRKASLTRIALACGFSSSSDFSRCFKQRFGSSPSAFNIDKWQATHRTELLAAVPEDQASDRLHIDSLPARRNPDRFTVNIRDLPARTVAYIRVLNPYQGDAVARAIERLLAWAERHACADSQWLGYQWDNPEIVSLKDCQYHVAVEVPGGTRLISEGDIGRFRFPPMTVAEVEVRGGIDLELRALQWVFGTWLPRSGYVPDHHPCFEAWIGRPFAHGTEYFEVRAQLPVRRA